MVSFVTQLFKLRVWEELRGQHFEWLTCALSRWPHTGRDKDSDLWIEKRNKGAQGWTKVFQCVLRDELRNEISSIMTVTKGRHKRQPLSIIDGQKVSSFLGLLSSLMYVVRFREGSKTRGGCMGCCCVFFLECICQMGDDGGWTNFLFVSQIPKHDAVADDEFHFFLQK